MKKLFLPLFLCLFACLIFARENSELKNTNQIFSITVDAGILSFMGDYIISAIKYAEKEQATALLINLDTPGGLYDTTRDIVKAILASRVPVIVYVSPQGARAGSAGTFIALSAHVLAMSPSTNIGAAHPVDASGEDIKGDMKDKITNDAKAWARSIAELRGKNAEWAEKAVVGSESITSEEALKIGVIDIVVNNEAMLLEQLDQKEVNVNFKPIVLKTKGAQIIPLPMPLSLEIMKFLSNPNLLYILMLLGILGIFIEFQSPGLILPGLFGVVILSIIFGVEILPINWFGALLIFSAVAFFIAEIFITSFGLLGIAGLAFLIFGSYLLFSVEGSSFFVEPLLIWLLSAGLLSIMLFIGFLLLKARGQKTPANVYALVGKTVQVSEEITPTKRGTVMVNGSFWQAESLDYAPKDSEVVILKVTGTLLSVEKK